MNDKKSCENCGRTKHFCESKGLCSQWLRNPAMWLSILPTEPGIYWWRKDADHKSHLTIRHLFMSDKLREHCLVLPSMSIKERGGQWQGPIKPEG